MLGLDLKANIFGHGHSRGTQVPGTGLAKPVLDLVPFGLVSIPDRKM